MYRQNLNETKRLLGVTVQPMYFQSEGIESVLDSLETAGVNAIAIAPAVYEQINQLPQGHDAGLSEDLPFREPPIDGGAGAARVVERLLWGKSEVLVKPSPSAPPNMEFYSGLRYQPSQATEFTDTDGGLIRQIIDSAHEREMKVYFQLSAVKVPGHSEEDLPLLPYGEYPRHRMVHTLSVASENVRAYVCAKVKDLITTYPEIDGLRHDWPEYPPYRLGDAFLDFSENTRKIAPRLGFDFEAMRLAANDLYKRLQHLSSSDIALLKDGRSIHHAVARVLVRTPAIAEVLRFKSELTVLYIRELREALDSVAPKGGIDLSPNAFPPPLSLLSGMNFSDVAKYADSINMKLYTMHWPQIVHFYAEELLAHNDVPLDEGDIFGALSQLFDFEDCETGPNLDSYLYPAPDVPHRAGGQAQLRKIRQAEHETGGQAKLYPIVHGYGPLEDFNKRLRIAWQSGTPGIWINRYCYLGEKKIRTIAGLT